MWREEREGGRGEREFDLGCINRVKNLCYMLVEIPHNLSLGKRINTKLKLKYSVTTILFLDTFYFHSRMQGM